MADSEETALETRHYLDAPDGRVPALLGPWPCRCRRRESQPGYHVLLKPLSWALTTKPPWALPAPITTTLHTVRAASKESMSFRLGLAKCGDILP